MIITEQDYAEMVAERDAALAEVTRVEADRKFMLRIYNKVTDDERSAQEWCAEVERLRAELVVLTVERDEWRRRAAAHGCDLETGDLDCG